jgi:hypothetical protein
MKLLPFRSDLRTKVSLDDQCRLAGGLVNLDFNKTPTIAMHVLLHVHLGCRLKFPGHILNACEYNLISSCWTIALPSRIPHWLFDNGWLDDEGNLTEKAVEVCNK